MNDRTFLLAVVGLLALAMLFPFAAFLYVAVGIALGYLYGSPG